MNRKTRPGTSTTWQVRGAIMKKLWLPVSPVCMSLGLHASGVGGPSVAILAVITHGSGGTLGNSSTAATLYATLKTFDPSTATFTAAGMMFTRRDFQTANWVGSGTVIVAGGESNANTEASADLFDSSSGSFTAMRTHDGSLLLSAGSGL